MDKRISSFAVFDLETTSLPDWNFNKTSITEISIHGLRIENVANATDCSIPRISHKLTLLFNPRMMIHPNSEKITQLNNEMLETESSMDVNAANIIINFLKHLRQPVCLVAHNGDKFDFPILKYAFKKLDMEIPEDVLCLDSLTAFKDLDLAQKEQTNEDTREDFVLPLPDIQKSNRKERESNALLPSDESNDSVLDLNIDDVNIPVNADKIDNFEDQTFTRSLRSPEKETLDSVINRQTLNETTPKRMPNYAKIGEKRKRQETPESYTSSGPRARKSLFGSTTAMTPISTATKIKSYKLTSIYERLFGSAYLNAHNAEADVISLQKIILKYGKSFVDYAEKNAKPFSEVKKLGAS